MRPDHRLYITMMVTYTLSHRDTALGKPELLKSNWYIVRRHVILIEVRDEEGLEGLLEMLRFQPASGWQAMEELPLILVGRGFTCCHLHGQKEPALKLDTLLNFVSRRSYEL